MRSACAASVTDSRKTSIISVFSNPPGWAGCFMRIPRASAMAVRIEKAFGVSMETLMQNSAAIMAKLAQRLGPDAAAAGP